jgi:hypothetical protein
MATIPPPPSSKPPPLFSSDKLSLPRAPSNNEYVRERQKRVMTTYKLGKQRSSQASTVLPSILPPPSPPSHPPPQLKFSVRGKEEKLSPPSSPPLPYNNKNCSPPLSKSKQSKLKGLRFTTENDNVPKDVKIRTKIDTTIYKTTPENNGNSEETSLALPSSTAKEDFTQPPPPQNFSTFSLLPPPPPPAVKCNIDHLQQQQIQFKPYDTRRRSLKNNLDKVIAPTKSIKYVHNTIKADKKDHRRPNFNLMQHLELATVNYNNCGTSSITNNNDESYGIIKLPSKQSIARSESSKMQEIIAEETFISTRSKQCFTDTPITSNIDSRNNGLDRTTYTLPKHPSLVVATKSKESRRKSIQKLLQLKKSKKYNLMKDRIRTSIINLTRIKSNSKIDMVNENDNIYITFNGETNNKGNKNTNSYDSDTEFAERTILRDVVEPNRNGEELKITNVKNSKTIPGTDINHDSCKSNTDELLIHMAVSENITPAYLKGDAMPCSNTLAVVEELQNASILDLPSCQEDNTKHSKDSKKNDNGGNSYNSNKYKYAQSSSSRVNAYIYGTVLGATIAPIVSNKAQSMLYTWMLGDVIYRDFEKLVSQCQNISISQSTRIEFNSFKDRENKISRNGRIDKVLKHNIPMKHSKWPKRFHSSNAQDNESPKRFLSIRVRLVSFLPFLGEDEEKVQLPSHNLNILLSPLLRGCELYLLTKSPMVNMEDFNKLYNVKKTWKQFQCSFRLGPHLSFLEWKSANGNQANGKIPIANVCHIKVYEDLCQYNEPFVLVDGGTIEASNVLALAIWGGELALVDVTVAFLSSKDRDVWLRGLSYCCKIVRYVCLE